MKLHRWNAYAMLAAALCVSTARADSVSVISDGGNSTEGIGSFSGSISYESTPLSMTGVLTVILSNTTDADLGGYITGFLFNIGSDDEEASATLRPTAETSYPFEQATGNGLNGMPYGRPYDAGAVLRGRFLGGGSPLDGIGVGETGSFVFDIEADDAAQLEAASFFDGGPFDFDFIVRFRGFADGGSDKVPAAMVPLPAPLAMGAIGLCGLVVAGRRRSNRTA